MKRKILSMIIFVTLIFSISSFVVFANDEVFSVYLNNEKLEFDVPPEIVNNRVMVPMRAVFEKLGATVTWETDTNTAYAVDYNKMQGVAITVGKEQMIDINMNIIPLDVPAITKNGRTLVPLRAISEAFGCNVEWLRTENTVNIYCEGFIDYSNESEQITVQVSTVDELLNNIGSNKRIVLISEYYNLSDAEKVENPYIQQQQDWNDSYLDGYIISDVINMTIEGNAQIATDDIWADVLSFKNCGKITLKGLTVGHTESFEEYRCEGAVTRFYNCDNINVDSCNLYGCGAFGIYADYVSDLNVTNSKIYDCSYTGIWLTNKSEAKVSNTEFFDSVHTSGFLRIDNSTIDCLKCNVYNITCDGFGAFIDTFDYGSKSSLISFTDCNFKNNKFDTITNDDGDKKIIFNGCTFQDNIGNMEHASVEYVNG